jgi:hypothetical protein
VRAGVLALLGLVLLATGLWVAVERKDGATRATAPLDAPGGQLVFRSGSYSARLTDGRCDHEDLEMAVLLDGGTGEAKAAVVMMGTTQRAACWAFNAGGSVVVRDYRASDRGQSEDVIPIDWFRREQR